MNYRYRLIVLVSLLITFSSLNVAQAQSTTPLPVKSLEQLLQDDGLNLQDAQSKPAGSVPAPIVPLVYAENLHVALDSSTNTIQGTFNLHNTETTYVGDINYELLLLSSAESSSSTELKPDNAVIFDRSLRLPALTVAPDQSNEVSFQYQPPRVPTGDYRLRVQLITSNDRSMGWATAPLYLEGEDALFSLLEPEEVGVSSKVYGGTEIRDTWAPLEGVNVDAGQTITLRSKAKNLGSATLKAKIHQEERRLLTNTPTTIETVGNEVEIPTNAEKDLSLEIQAPTVPGAYITYITLRNESATVSSLAQFRYVVRGPSASIVRATLDPASSPKKGSVSVNLIIVGPADRETTFQGTVIGTLMDGGRSIGNSSQKITLSAGTTRGTLSIPLNGATINEPILKLEIKGEQDQLLDTYEVPFNNLLPEDQEHLNKLLSSAPATNRGQYSKNSIMIIILSLALAVLLAIVLAYMQKRHTKSLPPPTITILLIIALGFGLFTHTTLASGIQHKFFFYTETVPWTVDDTYVDLFINSPVHNSTVKAGTVAYEARLWWAACLNQFHKGDIMVFSLPQATHFSFNTAIEPASPPWQGQGHYEATFDGGGSSDNWGRAISYTTNLDLSSFAPGSKTTIWTRAFTAARYASGEHVDSITNDFTFLNFANSTPIGYFDGAGSCQAIQGWACDSDNFSQALNIHLWEGAAGGSGSRLLTNSLQADQAGEANIGAKYCGGYNNHRFSYPISNELKDSRNHDIYAYAINTPAGDNTFLGKTTLNCPPPPPAPSPQPEVRVVKNAPSTVQPGGNLKYTLTATNSGQGVGQNIPVTDTIPSGTTFNSAVINGGSGSCSFSANTVTCYLINLAPNASASIQIFTTIPTGTACNTVIKNTAATSWGQSSTETTVTCPPSTPPSAPPSTGGLKCTVSPATPRINETVTLNALEANNTPANVTWEAVEGTPSKGNGTQFQTKYSQVGNKSVNILFDKGGQTYKQTCSVNVAAETTPQDVACTPSSQTISTGSQATFTGTYKNTPVIGNWVAPQASPLQGTGKTFSATYLTPGSYLTTFSYLDVYPQCSVTVINPPSPLPSASPSTLPTQQPSIQCSPQLGEISPGQPITFSTSSNMSGTYSWSANTGTPSTGSGSTFTTSFATTGKKTITVSNSSSSSVYAQCEAWVLDSSKSYECSDDKDNDGDAVADTLDPACHSDYDITKISSYVATNKESPDKVCSDGKDNDNDGRTDANDPACHENHDLRLKYNPTLTSEVDTQCSDKNDNDGDSLVDDKDPGCHSDSNANNSSSYVPADNDERNNVPVKVPGVKED